MKQFIKGLFSHGVSMTRFITLFIVIDIMGMWTATVIKDMIVKTSDMSLNDIPTGVVAIIGLVLAGKVAQKFAENGNGNGKTNIPAPTTPPVDIPTNIEDEIKP
jgi:hypothetical protein